MSATYERGSGGHVAERVRPAPGSDDEAKYEALAADPSTAWRRVEFLAPPPVDADDQSDDEAGDEAAPKPRAKSPAKRRTST